MTEKQAQMVTDWFWDVLPKDPDHEDRRMTSQGSKTKLGLFLVMESIVKAEGR